MKNMVNFKPRISGDDIDRPTRQGTFGSSGKETLRCQSNPFSRNWYVSWVIIIGE